MVCAQSICWYISEPTKQCERLAITKNDFIFNTRMLYDTKGNKDR